MRTTGYEFLWRVIKKFIEFDGPDTEIESGITELGKVKVDSPLYNQFITRSCSGKLKRSNHTPRTLMEEVKDVNTKAKIIGKAGVMVYRRPNVTGEVHAITAERHYELLAKERKLEKLKKGGANAEKEKDQGNS